MSQGATDVSRTGEARPEGPTLTSLFELWQLSTHLNPDALMRQVVPKLARIARAERISLMLLDRSPRTLRVRAALGVAPEVIAAAHVDLGEPIAGWVALRGQPLLLPDGPHCPEPVRRAMRRKEIASALCVPLKSHGRVVGVLNEARLKGQPFTRQDLQLAAMLGERLGACIETACFYCELEEREARSASLLENLPTGLVVVDQALRVVSANQSFLRTARRDARLIIGCTLAAVVPSARHGGLEERVREAFRSGRPVDGEKVTQRVAREQTRVYLAHVLPLRAPRRLGTPRGVESVAILLEDITEREDLTRERQRAERHLATVVEHAEDLALSLRPNGQIMTWNRAAEVTTQVKAREVIGKPLPNLCIGPQQKAMADLLRRVAGGETVQGVELSLRTREGNAVPIAWSAALVRTDEGQVTGIVALGRNLTERRSLETQLIQSAKIASLEVLAPAIAHELRNPLASALATAQLLIEEPARASDRADGLQRIRASIQRVVAIVENLLRLATPSEWRTEKVSINDLLKETQVLLDRHMTSHKIGFRMDLAPELSLVQANPVLLQQVFTNLILNACTAMRGGGQLTVAATVSEEGTVEIRFADTGSGIPGEHLPRVFEPFFTTDAAHGTGLGLSVSQKIIEQHGGTIEVDSEVGRGTTMTIRLPVAPTASRGVAQTGYKRIRAAGG